MAEQALTKNFREVLRKARNKFNGYIKNLGSEILVEYELNLIKLVGSSMKGTDEVRKAVRKSHGKVTADIYKNANTRQNWTKVVTKVLKKILRDKKIAGVYIRTFQTTQGKSPGKGVYFAHKLKNRKTDIHLLIFVPKSLASMDGWIQSILTEVTDNLWKEFTKSPAIKKSIAGKITPLSRVPTRSKTGRTQAVVTRFRTGFGTEHADENTKAVMGLEQIQSGRLGKWFRFNLNPRFQGSEIAEHIMNNVQIDWFRTQKKKRIGQLYGFNVKSILKFTLGRNRPRHTDLPGLVGVGRKFIKDEVRKAQLLGTQQPASVTIKDQIESQATIDIVKNIAGRFINAKTGRFVKVDYKAAKSKWKDGSRSAKLQKASQRGKTKQLTSPFVGFPKVTTGGTEKGKKPKTQTSQEDLLKIERLINKRLPAEVRRNMGRPALINRTGRFSNSAEVSNFRETAAGVSGDYTYRLSPYETFENTGQRKWPAGYNPKPLIAKSIKTIYYQYKTEQLVNLRRK